MYTIADLFGNGNQNLENVAKPGLMASPVILPRIEQNLTKVADQLGLTSTAAFETAPLKPNDAVDKCCSLKRGRIPAYGCRSGLKGVLTAGRERA